MRSRTCGGRVATLGGEGVHTGRKGRYTARISLLMKRSDLGRVRFEAVLRSVHRFVRLVQGGREGPMQPAEEGPARAAAAEIVCELEE